MIAKISRGADTAGLLRYLLGPGRANEHTDPHLIASWDNDPAALDPAIVDWRPRVGALAALLDQPLDALQRRPASTVWHCSLRNAPGDRRLSDQEWAEAARRVLDRVGLAATGDVSGCRWIAARHGDDHVHLLVTLARQDGRPARTPNDYRRAGQACQELEGHFGLTPTRARDSTAAKRPSRPEVEKANRAGRKENPRDVLRREVRLASVAALEQRAFFNELERNGLLVKTRRSTQHPEELTGYAVAWPGDHAPGGRPVWFSGGTLAPDLSLPRLRQRWEGVRHEVTRLQASPTSNLQRRTEWTTVVGAMAAVTAVPAATRDVARLTHAAASALTAVAHVVDGRGGGPLARNITQLSTVSERPLTIRGTDGSKELQLLAVAHVLLEGRMSGRRSRTNALHVERALLDVLRVFSRARAPQSLPHGAAVVEFAIPPVDGLGSQLRPSIQSQALHRGRAGSSSTGWRASPRR